MLVHSLKFRRLSGSFVICRLSANSSIPQSAISNKRFGSITSTDDELSIVCPSENAPQQYRDEIRWTCFELEGPFSFSQVGILNSFIAPLAEGKIPIFAVSTYDTDYVLVKEEDTQPAIQALQAFGHQLIPDVI